MIAPDALPDTQDVARHYDDLDEFYREVWGDHVHHGYWKTGRESPAEAVEQLVHELARRAELTAGERVCDVGCGYGATARLLASQYSAQVTGFTVSSAQWQYAHSLAAENRNPTYVLCDWLQNGLAANSFDAVISIECFSHIENKQAFFGEIKRVLKPGGRAAIAVWLSNAAASARSVYYLLKPICQEGRLPGLANATECRDMIQRAGLELESFEEASQSVQRTWTICARRLAWNVMTQRRYLSALLDRSRSNRVFALTLFRILFAYWNRSMQYGMFVMRRPEGDMPAGGE